MPKNSILFVKRQFCACFSNYSNSLNFEVKISCNTNKPNDLKKRKTCTGLKFDLEHFNGPQTKFICDSLYKHPVFVVLYGKLSQFWHDRLITGKSLNSQKCK